MATVGKKKGSAKTGGRKKGTLNKVNATVTEQLASLNCDPIGGMAKIGERAMAEGDYNLAFQVFRELGQYVAPKRKSLEVNAHVSFEQSLHDLSDEELDATLKGYSIDATRV